MLGLLLTVAAVGCAARPEKAVIGAWLQEGGAKAVEFFPEGTISFSDRGLALTGNYKFLDATRVRLDFAGVGAIAGPVIMTVAATEAGLVLTDQKGQATGYRRASKDEVAKRVAENARNDEDRARKTMSAMRSLAISCEAFSVDHGDYPAAKNLTALQPKVVPTYIRELPLIDAWDQPFEYSCDGKSYEIRSLGSDGGRDAAPHSGANTGFTADIVFRDGAFDQWPAAVPTGF